MTQIRNINCQQDNFGEAQDPEVTPNKSNSPNISEVLKLYSHLRVWMQRYSKAKVSSHC